MADKIFMTARECADEMGVHILTIERWAKKGLLPFFKAGPRFPKRIRREDWERFIQSKTTEKGVS
jgi:excisionase family DNA binding protein